MTLKNAEVVVLATATAKPWKEAELERALRDVAGPTRAQGGCLQFELYRSAQDPATITAFERWSSEEDHARHIHGEHVKTLIARFDGILAAPPEVVPMKPLSKE
jgi:quinol monooxygenase YgiN